MVRTSLGLNGTGQSLSEALIFASTNQQCNDRLFIDLQVQYMKIPNSEHGENMWCTKNFWMPETISVHTNMFSPGLSLEFSCNLMNNQSSHCWLVDAKIRASDKDLPVKLMILIFCT